MKQGNISDLKLERFLLKELNSKEYLEIKNELDKDEKLQKRLDYLKSSNKEILNNDSIGKISSKIVGRINEERDRRSKSLRKKILFISSSIAASIFLVYPFFIDFFKSNHNMVGSKYFKQGKEITRVKGNVVDVNRAKLIIYKKNKKGPILMKNNEIVFEKNLIQLAYKKGTYNYGMIFSIDGRDELTLHYPKSMDSSTELKKNNIVYLKDSYELDNAPKFEKFYFITSQKPIDVCQVITQIKLLIKNQNQISKVLSESYMFDTVNLIKGEALK